MSSLPPYDIAGGFRRKEDWAIAEIWKSNEAMVNKLISRFLGQTPFNQDLAADVLVALLTYKGVLFSLDDIRRFLNQATINRCKDQQKKKETQESNQDRLIYHYRSMEQDDIEIAEAMAHQQMLIRRQIAKIPGKSGQVFYMYYIRKLSISEIASQLGITEKTISNHMSAASKFLKMDRESNGRSYAYPLLLVILIYLYENL